MPSRRSPSPPALEPEFPAPTILLMGCRPWDAQPFDLCPVCKGSIPKAEISTHCLRCNAASPGVESRILAARVGLRVRSETEDAERDARAELRKIKRSGPLTEAHKRRIWMGYSRNGINSRNKQVVNRARVGREFLAQIGQLPDWSLVLDAKGRVIARLDEPIDPDAPRDDTQTSRSA